MNKNIDLTKILKDCPEGTKFYSPIFGEVKITIIKNDKDYPIAIFAADRNIGPLCRLSKNGKYNIQFDGECLLFPSKEQRDWSKFTAPWLKKERFDPKTLSPFDRVLARNHGSHRWTCDLFSDIIDGNECMYHCIGSYYRYCIPYNDETKHLVGTKNEAPNFYRYWEE